MTQQRPDSEDVLRHIDDLGAEAEHTDEDARMVLTEAGIDPDRLVRGVHREVRMMLATDRRPPGRWAWVRNWAMAVSAASAAAFVVLYSVNARAGLEAQRQLARAQLIGPLLPALTSEDPERRSIALVVARQVDPAFADETSARLARWEVTTQAQARANRNSVYAARFLAGLHKLELSRDPDDRKVAIWDDLLPVLQEARKSREDFVDVALAYQDVLPLLRVRDPEVFLDSYWGELWILNILLESKIDMVVQAARQQAPEPSVVDGIYEKHARTLPDRDRKAFQEAVAVYRSTWNALR
jgi:hypothetical protein